MDYATALNQWQANRKLVSHPSIFHQPDALAAARSRLKQGDLEIGGLADKLLAHYGYLLDKDKSYLERMIPETTPGPCHFNLSPEHDLAVPHGMWKWDPQCPDVITDANTGTSFPNDHYPEEGVLETNWGKPQRFTFYTGKSIDYNGFHLFPSFSGLVRTRKVQHMIDAAYNLAFLYHLTLDMRYAAKAAEILLRFADVYPYWLVHGMYGDIADMDPKTAALNPKMLPKPRTALAPNPPLTEIHVGYWGLGRATPSGMEGTSFLLPMSVAYDLIADVSDADGNPLFTEEEKIKIERDVLIEGASSVVHDPAFNNKATGNQIGVSAVGMVAGIDGYVEIGRKCFQNIVEKWYLPDGSTSESPAYSMMVMGTMWILSEMLEVRAASGDEHEKLPVYRWSKYEAVWKGMYDTLLQNLRYPASADSYERSQLSRTFSAVLAYRFGRPEYAALLDRTIGETEKTRSVLHFLPPHSGLPAERQLEFRDLFFPDLRHGYLRIGDRNEQGTLILYASDWGIHHHRDSLNLFYYWGGKEWLSDLGYLWDQPEKHMTVRTPAHQLVVIDEQEQQTQGRGGALHHFVMLPHLKLVDASSSAYPNALVYRRAVLLLQHNDKDHYVLDLFHTDGGQIKDYVLHGPHEHYELNDIRHVAVDEPLPYGLEDPLRLHPSGSQPYICWRGENDEQFRVWLPANEETPETLTIGTGWGQRGKTDVGAKLPYLIRRREKEETDTFVALLGASRGAPIVRSFMSHTDNAGKSIAIRVQLGDGKEDLVVYRFEPDATGHSEDKGEVNLTTPWGTIRWNGTLAIIQTRNGQPEKATLYGGTELQWNGSHWKAGWSVKQGAVLETEEEGFLTDASYAAALDWVDRTIYVSDSLRRTGYRVLEVADRDGQAWIRTRQTDGEGFICLGGDTWRMENISVFEGQSKMES